MQKIFAWLLFLVILILNLGLAWWFWIGYSLLTPHSGIIYSGWAYWSWKLLLVQCLLDVATLFIHLFLGGKALLHGDISKARKISFVIILILSLQLTLSFIR